MKKTTVISIFGVINSQVVKEADELIANYKLAMAKIDISVEDYIDSMIKTWEHKLEHEEADDQLEFDAFVLTVERLAETQG